ncbi:MAG: archaeosortase/exosortase family protein, partial [Candidatus Bathyarchaeia archaeon]
MCPFNKTKDYYQHILAASLIILLVILVYWQDLVIVANEALNSEALSHVVLVPFFVGFIFYQKKDLFAASLIVEGLQKKSYIKFVDELMGLSLCLIALLIYWYGSYTFHPLAYHMLSLPIFISGVILILFNLKTLRIMLPSILLLLFLVPIPNEIM